MSNWPMPHPDEIVAQFPIGKNDRLMVAFMTSKRGPVLQILRARVRADGRLPITAPRVALPAMYLRQLLAALGCADALLSAAVPITEEGA